MFGSRHVKTRQRVEELAPDGRATASCCASVIVCLPMLLRSLARPALLARHLPRHSTILTRAMSITHLDNTAQLDGILGKSKDKLSVRLAKRFARILS